jgi:predicted DNA-binding protein
MYGYGTVDICKTMAYNHGMKYAKNFHIPLPGPTYDELKDISSKIKKPATQIVRELIEYWLKERKKSQLHKEIMEFAQANAGTTLDLDKDLETIGLKHLFELDPSRKSRKN